MTSTVLSHRAVLADKTDLDRDGISLYALPEGHVLQLLGRPDLATAPEAALAAAEGRPCGLRALSPGQWYLVGDRPLTDKDIALLVDRLGGEIDLVDQSHGRVRIALAGEGAATVLSKGTAVDLHLDAFPPGASAATLIGHISVHLTRTGQDRFELIVLRGFAGSLWDELAGMV